jgi:serine/threonine-protein kinase/endoribonuclease IRE1
MHDMTEVNLLRKLSHDNVVSVEDFSQHQSSEFSFIALELCHGDLERLVETPPNGVRQETAELLPRPLQSVETRRDIARQILVAVAFLHEKGVAHRDLKPSNILFVESDKTITIKVADFGISKALDEGVTSYTQTSMAGSKGYQAQELVLLKLGEHSDSNWRPTNEDFKKADIFSFGLLVYYVLTGGLHPFSNPDPRRIKRIGDRETRIADGEPPNLEPIEDSEAKHFFQTTLNHKAKIRPSAQTLYSRTAPRHPYFLTPANRMSVIRAADKLCKVSRRSQDGQHQPVYLEFR